MPACYYNAHISWTYSFLYECVCRSAVSGYENCVAFVCAHQFCGFYTAVRIKHCCNRKQPSSCIQPTESILPPHKHTHRSEGVKCNRRWSALLYFSSVASLLLLFDFTCLRLDRSRARFLYRKIIHRFECCSYITIGIYFGRRQHVTHKKRWN